MPNLAHIPPNCDIGTIPSCFCLSVACTRYTVFQSTYNARGIPYFSTQARNVSATPQVVSSDVNVARLVLVASSTMWIRQPRGPRVSSQFSKLPSIYTAVQINGLTE